MTQSVLQVRRARALARSLGRPPWVLAVYAPPAARRAAPAARRAAPAARRAAPAARRAAPAVALHQPSPALSAPAIVPGMFQHAYRLGIAVGAPALVLGAAAAAQHFVLGDAGLLDYGLAGLAVWGLLQALSAALRSVEKLAAARRSLRPREPLHLGAPGGMTACGLSRAELGAARSGFVTYDSARVTCEACRTARP